MDLHPIMYVATVKKEDGDHYVFQGHVYSSKYLLSVTLIILFILIAVEGLILLIMHQVSSLQELFFSSFLIKCEIEERKSVISVFHPGWGKESCW